MLNSNYKKKTIEDLKKENCKYEEKYEELMKMIEILYKERCNSVNIIKYVEEYINTITNKPKEFKKNIDFIELNLGKFEDEINNISVEIKKAEKIAGGTAGAGTIAGVGVAAFGPSAAMAVATTFGTASTGAAISGLGGAAATNAALAWLGGGALAAGGGGMAAGNAFLALAGPVGWAIGGASFIGSGIFLNSKNKKAAKKAEEETKRIKKEILKLDKLNYKVKYLKIEIEKLKNNISHLLLDCRKVTETNYLSFDDFQKDRLTKLLNYSKSLSEKLGEKIE